MAGELVAVPIFRSPATFTTGCQTPPPRASPRTVVDEGRPQKIFLRENERMTSREER